METIENLRVKIDEIDDEILELLNQRMSFVTKIGELKNASGAPIYRPERERAIIARLGEKRLKFMPKRAIEAIFYEIFSISRNLEKPQNVAFLGPIGTYSHGAAKSKFGAISSYLPLASIEAVFTSIANGEAKYAVVPAENNTEGAVGATLDCLAKYQNVKIVGEIYMDIHHSFASNCEKLSDIQKIFSHPQGYNQCLKFLEDHRLTKVEFIPSKSTALAAYNAAQTPNCAAICSPIAASIYNVPIMFEKIEDNLANRTRFFVLSDFKSPKTNADKTTIFAKTTHEPGSLAQLLGMFYDENINLTKLESRPLKQKDFRFVFFIDFIGHVDDNKVQKVFEKVAKKGYEISWLGSYLNGDEE